MIKLMNNNSISGLKVNFGMKIEYKGVIQAKNDAADITRLISEESENTKDWYPKLKMQIKSDIPLKYDIDLSGLEHYPDLKADSFENQKYPQLEPNHPDRFVDKIRNGIQAIYLKLELAEMKRPAR